MLEAIIYSLSDPFTEKIRYVGKCTNISKRFKEHLKEKSDTHKSHWIKNLIKLGENPIIEELDIVSEKDWEFWERYWISQIKSWGFSLTNATDGGEGGNIFGKLNKERKKIFLNKVSKASRKRWENMSETDRELDSKQKSIRMIKNNPMKNKDAAKKTSIKCKFHIGELNSFFGKKHSNISKQRISETIIKNLESNINAKVILKIDCKTGKVLDEYLSLGDAARINKFNKSNIKNAVNNIKNQKTANGYIWKYK